jgi:hypothetical protein
MWPIRAIPSSVEPSDRTGGTPAQTGQRSYGSARLQCESCPRPAERGRVWALASESPPVVPVPGSGPCPRRHRLARVARRAGRGTQRATPPPAAARPRPVRRLRFDSPRWHGRRSPHLLTAWPAHHRLRAAPSHIYGDPRGWDPSGRPFCCGLLGAVQQHFIPVDPLQGFIALGQLAPCAPKGIQFPPDLEPPLHGFVGRQARGQHPPPPARHQAIEHGVQTCPVVVGPPPIATPDHGREQWRQQRPHVLGHPAGKVSQLPGDTSWRQRSDVSRIKSQRGFVP